MARSIRVAERGQPARGMRSPAPRTSFQRLGISSGRPPAALAARNPAVSGRAAAPRASQPRATAPAVRGRAAPARGGGGGGARSTGRVSSNPSGNMSMAQDYAVAPPPEPAVPTMSQDEYIGQDSTYQDQLAQLQKALGDYQAQMGQQKTQYGVDYSAKVNELGIARKRGQGDLENDFAGRGMLQSGLFGQNQSELMGQFDRRQGDMDRAKGDFETGLAQGFSNFQSEQGLTSQRARNEAIARYAAQFGL